jgi:hypothetical protein
VKDTVRGLRFNDKGNCLPPRFYGEVIDFVGYIKEKKMKKYLSLEKAAEMAAEDYKNDKELTVFHNM